MNYLEMLDAERRNHFPPFATLSDFRRRRNPDKPRNWPMAGESYIRDETNKVREALEDALAARPEYMKRWKQLLAVNVRKGTKNQGIVAFPLEDIMVQVERRDESLRILTCKTADILDTITRERRWYGNIGRSFQTFMGGIGYPGRGNQDYPVTEFINLNHRNGIPEIGLEYIGPAIYRIPYGRTTRIHNDRLPQRNTTAARDGILDFARRLRMGNLELSATTPVVYTQLTPVCNF